MSILNKVKSESSSKIATAIILTILVVGGTYSFLNKKDNSALSQISNNKSSNLDSNDAVDNVADVEKVISKWVENNPEAIVQSIVVMQQKAAQKQLQNAQQNISSKKDDLFNHPGTPFYAPKGYDVEVVEFFDYNCGYCKRANKTITKLLEEDKKVKFVSKEYPILGASSEELASIAIAVNIISPDSYFDFHNALMKSSARSKSEALKIAQDIVGLDAEKIKQALIEQKDKIKAEIEFNRRLGSSIGINGTPAFVVGEELISGAVQLEVLKEKIREARKSK